MQCKNDYQIFGAAIMVRKEAVAESICTPPVRALPLATKDHSSRLLSGHGREAAAFQRSNNSTTVHMKTIALLKLHATVLPRRA
jgi:hypothetical protein